MENRIKEYSLHQLKTSEGEFMYELFFFFWIYILSNQSLLITHIYFTFLLKLS
ncbi:MAG: hypothetical protein ABI840_01525 [bacterium]